MLHPTNIWKIFRKRWASIVNSFSIEHKKQKKIESEDKGGDETEIACMDSCAEQDEKIKNILKENKLVQ